MPGLVILAYLTYSLTAGVNVKVSFVIDKEVKQALTFVPNKPCLLFIGGLWPKPQTIDMAGKACQVKHTSLSYLFISDEKKVL